MSSDESIWRMRVMSAATPEYVGELVRCKDCEMSCVPDDDGGYGNVLSCAWWSCYSNTYGDLLVNADDFCSHGVKKRED